MRFSVLILLATAGLVAAQDVRSAVAAKYQQIDAAIAAGHFCTATQLNSDVSRLLSEEWRKQLPTSAQMLAKEEDSLSTKAGNDPTHRIYFLWLMPNTAYQAGEFEKAGYYAKMLLETAAQAQQTNVFGDAIFEGNTVLGQVALRTDDVETAKRSLIQSVSAASAALGLSRAGLRYDLAQALLDRGQGDTVVQFLKACQTFRPQDNEKYKVWIAAIQGGANPKLTRF